MKEIIIKDYLDLEYSLRDLEKINIPEEGFELLFMVANIIDSDRIKDIIEINVPDNYPISNNIKDMFENHGKFSLVVCLFDDYRNDYDNFFDLIQINNKSLTTVFEKEICETCIEDSYIINNKIVFIGYDRFSKKRYINYLSDDGSIVREDTDAIKFYYRYNYLVLVGENLEIINTKNNNKTKMKDYHSWCYGSHEFTISDKYLASFQCCASEIYLWSLKSLSLEKEIKMDYDVFKLYFHPDNQNLICSLDNGKNIMYDTATNNKLDFPIHFKISQACFNDCYIICADELENIAVLDYNLNLVRHITIDDSNFFWISTVPDDHNKIIMVDSCGIITLIYILSGKMKEIGSAEIPYCYNQAKILTFK